MSGQPREYRFADSSRPGLLLGVGPRQAIPIVAGVLWLAAILQLPLPPVVGLIGPVVGTAIAFGRWRGSPLAETLVPGTILLFRRRVGRARWTQAPLLGSTDADLPSVMRGLELIEFPDRRVAGLSAVVRDRDGGTVTGVVRVSGSGFPLASTSEQDAMLARWGAVLSPFARERSPVIRVTWQEWAHPVGSDQHLEFLDSVGVRDRSADPVVADYLALLQQQAPVTVAHDVLVSITIDQRRVRRRRSQSGRLEAAFDVLADELRLFASRLDGAGLVASAPLGALALSSAVRFRSDPLRSGQVQTLERSLAAAARGSQIEWGPMVVEPEWSHVRVDGALHRTYRVAAWPQLSVGSDWLSPLLTDARATRTVTVVMEPIPISRAARAADREVMSREADAELKERKGFRVNARERKRLADVEARERELSEGHAEFRFVGLVTVTSTDADTLDEECADIEQTAAQSLLDLRPLDARHELGWLASLPLGRSLAPSPGS
ncbi:MAG: hypothetical protein CL424_14720 [Acidimicrobiaceae bacterium]|nr:hypothetical protein [Acidimicrobiaceae bacterium]